MNRAFFSPRLEGLIYWAASILMLFSVLAPPLSNWLENNQAQVDTADLITRHQATLRQPLPADENLKYRSYLAQSLAPSEVPLDDAAIQAALLQNIRTQQVRLLDLRQASSPDTFESLETLTYQLELEGDLEATLGTLESLGRLSFPVLLDTIELRPTGRGDRPDRFVRLSITLSVWRQTSNV